MEGVRRDEDRKVVSFLSEITSKSASDAFDSNTAATGTYRVDKPESGKDEGRVEIGLFEVVAEV